MWSRDVLSSEGPFARPYNTALEPSRPTVGCYSVAVARGSARTLGLTIKSYQRRLQMNSDETTRPAHGEVCTQVKLCTAKEAASGETRRIEVSQNDLNFWQSLARCTAYAAYTAMETS